MNMDETSKSVLIISTHISLCKGDKLKPVALAVIKKLLPEWRDVESIEMNRVSGALTK